MYANLPDYIKYQESTGSVVKMVTIPTTKAEEDAIKNRADAIGDPRGLTCALSVSAALGGVCGIQKTRFPGNLYDEAKKASCEPKKLVNNETLYFSINRLFID